MRRTIARSEGTTDIDLERGDADIQEDLELSLMQFRAEMLSRVDAALFQLGEGRPRETRSHDAERRREDAGQRAAPRVGGI